MKKAIIGTALILSIPFTAVAWDDRDYYQDERNALEIGRLAIEARQANEYTRYILENERFDRDYEGLEVFREQQREWGWDFKKRRMPER